MANNYNNFNCYQQYAFVNGIEGAKAFPMPYNSSILLMDSDNPICSKKTSDSQGKCTLEWYKLVPIDEATVRSLTQPMPNQNGQTDFASKEDIANINKRLDDLFKMMNKSTNRKEVKDNNA